MKEQIYYEDVTVGDEIPRLIKHPTTGQLVRWAGACGDYNPIHYDKDFAQSRGLPGVIVHGQLAACFLGQLVTDWIGEGGTVKKLSFSYKSMNFPEENLSCHGKVTRKYTENGEHLIDCSLWLENTKGGRTVSGQATVIMPSRNSG